MTTKQTLLLIAFLPMLAAYTNVTAEDQKPKVSDESSKAVLPAVPDTDSRTAPAKAPGATSSEPLSDALLRDPFWPIAWQPKDWGRSDDKKLEGLKRWESAIKQIKLTGISKDKNGNFFVVVKGQGVKEAGDTITADYSGLTYTWVIRKITEKGIVPEQLHAEPTKQ